MIRKEIVSPGRVRRIPEGFGWVDHRLVRKGYLKERSRESLSLYLFLVIVADADGVSYYSDESLCDQLNFTFSELKSSRIELVNAELVAYRKPFYQVLKLPSTADERANFARVLRETQKQDETFPGEHGEDCVSVGEIIKSMVGGQENDRL